MARKKVTGICHICGKHGKLSYEHVPPAAAFNSTSTKVYKALDLIRDDALPWDIEGIEGKILQRGSGGYTLCESCNSFTGAKYAKTFISACDQLVNKGQTELIGNGSAVKVGLKDINPLFFGKQILTMFASVAGERFFEAQPELRKLVLDQDSYGIDTEKYALFMYYFRGGTGRQSGLSVQMRTDGNSIMSAELTTQPYGFVLVIDPNREILMDVGTEVTGLLHQYDSSVIGDFLFELPIYEQNSPMPLDFRTQEEILSVIKKGKTDE